jgi:hypothetical protein
MEQVQLPVGERPSRRRRDEASSFRLCWKDGVGARRLGAVAVRPLMRRA